MDSFSSRLRISDRNLAALKSEEAPLWRNKKLNRDVQLLLFYFIFFDRVRIGFFIHSQITGSSSIISDNPNEKLCINSTSKWWCRTHIEIRIDSNVFWPRSLRCFRRRNHINSSQLPFWQNFDIISYTAWIICSVSLASYRICYTFI